MIAKPIGIDLPIQQMQQLFINNLWPTIDTQDKMFYQRVFRNERNGNLYPEVLIEGTNDYQEVEFDDRLSALCWFDVANETNSYDLGQINQNVGIFFAVNLSVLYPTLSHRAIEEAHLDVQKIITKRIGEWNIQGIITNMDAYGDFSTDRLMPSNMQPWHVFRFDCNLKYSLNC